MISKEEVKHVAKLARIEFSEEELSKLQKELAKILDYIETLKEIDIQGVEPTSHSVILKNVFREDKPKKPVGQETLIKLAPQKREKFIKIKPVF